MSGARRPAGSLGVGAYDDGPVGYTPGEPDPVRRKAIEGAGAFVRLVLPVERTSPGEPLDPLPPAVPRCPACGRIDCPTLRRADGADLDACAARVVRTDGGKP